MGMFGLKWWQLMTWLFGDFVQSKRTDEPPLSKHMCLLFCFENHTDPHVCGSILQQPESRPRRNEPWSQEADAGAVPQHEQVRGHQRAADKVSFLCRCIRLTSRPDAAGRWACWLLYPKNYFFYLSFFFRGANLSESEAEQDGEHNITELPQVCSGRGNMASQQSAVRLTEVSVSEVEHVTTVWRWCLDGTWTAVSTLDWSSHDSATNEGSRRHGGREHPLSRHE